MGIPGGLPSADQELFGRYHSKGPRNFHKQFDPKLDQMIEQQTTLGSLAKTNLKTARAYHLRLAFQDIYKERSRDWAGLFLDKWYSWARRSRLEPMKQVAATIDRHREGILAWFDSGIANGLIEGINSLVQAAKAKARGYRNRKTLKAVTYLIAGKLDLRLPT